MVTVDRESHVIRLVHYTTQEYFERVRNEIFPTIQVEITKACINYLRLEDFGSDEYTQGKNYIKVNDELHSKYPFLDYAGKHWGHHARGETENLVRDEICSLLGQQLRLYLACQIIDNTIGRWDFGPMPSLTLLVYFGLESVISNSISFEENGAPTCAIRLRQNALSFLFVENRADWHDRRKNSLRAECSSFQLKGNETMISLLADKGVKMDLSVDEGEFLFWWSLMKDAGGL